jgi:predicted RNA-binding Zn ribbon-like protein
MIVSMDLDRLETVRRLVNTVDPDTGADDLETPAALVAWLAERGVIASGTIATQPELARACALREALRELLFANAGGDAAPGAVETLDRQARRSRVTLGFDAHGGTLEPQGAGVDGALGRILSGVASAMADGSWARLKACRADDCRWAFVDRTRNGSRHWCDMRVCGNRQKARAFRARHAR